MKRCSELLGYILSEKKEGIANMLNSFALWTKFYEKVKEGDFSWIQDQIANDPQIKKYFDIYGIYDEKGKFVWGNYRLPVQVVKYIKNFFQHRYRPGDEVEDFFYSFVQGNKDIYFIGASCLGNDDGKLLSYDILFFGKSLKRMVSELRAINLRVQFDPTKLRKGEAYFPLKNYQGKVLAYLVIPQSAAMKKELEKLSVYKWMLVFILVVYAFLLSLFMQKYKRQITKGISEIMRGISSIVEMEPELEDLKKLSLREDEIGLIAKALLPIATAITERVIMDPLTGAYNRAYFFLRLEEELARFERFLKPFSIVLFDLDNFKRVNDIYGHPAGDKVLKELAYKVLGEIRRVDIFARIGGDEFGIIFPETKLDGAVKACEKIKSEIEKTEFCFGQEKVVLKASFGVTQVKETDTAESLYERADRALYMAKSQGKAKIVPLI